MSETKPQQHETSAILCNSPTADRFAQRLLALAELCPQGKLMKFKEGPRQVDCKKTPKRTEINIKISINNYGGDHTLLCRVIIESIPNEKHITLLNKNHNSNSGFFTEREKKYISAMLLWAENNLPSAKPSPIKTKIPNWQIEFTTLYSILSGNTIAAARKKLNDAFFETQEDSSSEQRTDELIQRLRDNEHILCFDWKEDDRSLCIAQLANKRRIPKSPRFHSLFDPQSEAWLKQLHLFLEQQGLSIISIDSGMDSDYIGIVSRSKLDELNKLLTSVGRRLWVDIDPHAG